MFPDDAKIIFETAVSAVQPRWLLPRYIQLANGELQLGERRFPLTQVNRFIVIAAGKAAASMAQVTESLAGEIISKGICITKYQHALPLQRFEIFEAGHPYPDENGFRASRALLQVLQNLSEKDIVLLLLSGGASALLADTPPGCTSGDIISLNQLLVNSGASIQEINTVRKHCSRIKGGQLAAAAFPATVVAFLISDVPGDDPAVIASGPVVPDPSTFGEALEILRRYELLSRIPLSVRDYLLRGQEGREPETPKPGSAIFKKNTTRVIACNRIALEAAAAKAMELGFTTHLQKEALLGDTGKEAEKFIRNLQDLKGEGPVCLIAGGETVLKVNNGAKGGRNQHFALCALKELAEQPADKEIPPITLLAAGTDGTDGPTDAAGACFDGCEMLSKENIRSHIRDHIQQYDSYSFFQKYGGLLITGPTQTNVMDIAIGIMT